MNLDINLDYQTQLRSIFVTRFWSLHREEDVYNQNSFAGSLLFFNWLQLLKENSSAEQNTKRSYHRLNKKIYALSLDYSCCSGRSVRDAT